LNDISPSRSPYRYAALAAVALTILTSLFSHLGAMGLVGPDEPRYAWIARAMATTGDWVTPRLYGQPWFEKPVLFYWLAAIGFKLDLPQEWAARLPSAVAALAAAFIISWLAWKHYRTESDSADSSVALAPLIFSTTVAAIGFARAATPDMLFSACLTLAMASAACILRRAGAITGGTKKSGATSHPDLLALLLFGTALALSVLAKGPAGVILAAGALCIWALATGKWRVALRLAHPPVIAAFCVIALPWYILCQRRNPDFFHAFIFQHNFERYLTPVFQHKQPFWFFGPMLLIALLPWTALLIPAVQDTLRSGHENSWRDSPGFFVASWAIFPVFFFSFSQSKLPGYILPAIPPLALLIAVSCTRRHAEPLSKSYRVTGFALALMWLLMAGSSAVLIHRLPPAAQEATSRTFLLCAALAIAGALVIAILVLLHRRGALLVSAIVVALLVEIAGARILPTIDAHISARPHAQFLANDRRPDRIFTYRLNRSLDYGLAFYLNRELPEWSPQDPQPALVLTNPKGLEEIRKLRRLGGELDETYRGILYVPILPSSANPR
jgi:4-amino-4-deoxy-L-arabinose transferase-like glycosyltransferase